MKLNEYIKTDWLKEDIHKTLHIHKLVHSVPVDGYYDYSGERTGKQEVNLVEYNNNLIFVL